MSIFLDFCSIDMSEKLIWVKLLRLLGGDKLFRVVTNSSFFPLTKSHLGDS